jgi:hypothetical protein
MQTSLQSSTSLSNVLYSTIQLHPQNACEFKESLKYNMYLYFFLSTMNYSLPAGSPSIFGGKKKSKKRKPFKKLKKSYKKKQRGGQPKYQAILQTFSFLYNAVFQYIPDTNFLFSKTNNKSISNSESLQTQNQTLTELKQTTNFDISDNELVERFINLHSIQNLFNNQTGTCTLGAYLTLGSIDLNEFAYLYNDLSQKEPSDIVQMLLRRYDSNPIVWESYFNIIYNKNNTELFMLEIITTLKQLRKKENTNFMTLLCTSKLLGGHALVVLLTSSNEIAFIDFQRSMSSNLNKKNKLVIYTVSGDLPKVLQSQSDLFQGALLHSYLESIPRCEIFKDVIFQIDNPAQSISSKNPDFEIATETVEDVNFYENPEKPDYFNNYYEIKTHGDQIRNETQNNSSFLKEELDTKGYFHPSVTGAVDALKSFYESPKQKFEKVLKAKKTNNKTLIKNKFIPKNMLTVKYNLHNYLIDRKFKPLPQGYLDSIRWPNFLPICSELKIDLYKLYTLINGKPFKTGEQIFFQQDIPMTKFLSILESNTESKAQHVFFLWNYKDILTLFGLNDDMTVSDFFSKIRDTLSYDMTKTDANNKTNLAFCTSKNRNSLIFKKYEELQRLLNYIK